MGEGREKREVDFYLMFDVLVFFLRLRVLISFIILLSVSNNFLFVVINLACL